MADINVERKGPSIWPWVIGLLVLALLIWAIAEMVDTDEDVTEVAETDGVEQVEEPPAAVPEPEPVEPEPGVTPDEAVELEELLPLNSDDIGRPVLIEGEVVGEPIDDGFWLRVDNDETHALFVQTPVRTEDGETLETTDVESGDELEIVGVVQRMDGQLSDRAMQDTNVRDETDFEQWTVHEDLRIENTWAMAPGTQQRPPQEQQPQQQPAPAPGAQQDTAAGRY